MNKGSSQKRCNFNYLFIYLSISLFVLFYYGCKIFVGRCSPSQRRIVKHRT